MNTFKKVDETGQRILEAALALFRAEGFDKATMRGIAAAAEVATGAAYYYFESKEAIVLAFYQRSAAGMQPLVDEAITASSHLGDGLAAAIRAKLTYFGPNRTVLRALLRSGADPANPLSPFSAATKAIRDADIASFRKLLDHCGVKAPRDLAPHLPEALWLLQMGVILFWLIDTSPAQERTFRLLESAAHIAQGLIRLAGLPLTRPLRKPVIELIEIVKEA